MFTIDNNITDLNIKEKDMVKVFFSMNNHQVATPEMMLEEAQSYILFFQESYGQLSSYIGLHLLLTGRKLFYAHSSNPFPEGAMASVEEEAFCFVEGLGAMLDTIDFTKMSSGEKKSWIDKQEIFAQKPAEESKPEAAPVEAAPQEAVSAPQPPPAQTAAPALPAEPPAPEMPDIQQPPQAHAVPQPPQQPVQPAPPAPRAPQQSTVLETPQASLPHHDEAAGQEAAAAPGAEELEPYHDARQSVPSDEPEKKHPQPAPRAAARKSAAPAPSDRGQDIMQKAINAGIVKPPKVSLKKEAQSATGVVSRDREALARLLTSF
jgi:hypothetical protein